MSKYDLLGDFLQKSKNVTETLSFQEIENILGFRLPDSAYNHRPWWANDQGGNHSHAKSWMNVGWETGNVRLGDSVTFSKTANSDKNSNTNNDEHQKTGSSSNAHAGQKFEKTVFDYLSRKGIVLNKKYKIEIGVDTYKKSHEFDLGNNEYLVECKNMTWTKSGNMPSAKITSWIGAMYYFHLAPPKYKKIFFVKKSYNEKKKQTLMQYFIENKKHLIPNDVLLYEYDDGTGDCKKY